MNTTEKKFKEAVLSLIPGPQADNPVLVAFSGGCDSLALLALFVSVFGSPSVRAVYVNHKIRPNEELSQEIDLNRSNCSALGLELIVHELEDGEVASLSSKRGGGIEDAARFLRYKVLKERAQSLGCSFLATAHHKEDQEETVIMRLMRGSPFSSLKGIEVKNENVIRPLLGFNKAELEAYLKSKNLSWSSDSTNSSTEYLRNRVRLEIIPSLKQILPAYSEVLASLSKKSRELSIPNVEITSSFLPLETLKGLSYTQKTVVLFSLWDKVLPEKPLPMTLIKRVLAVTDEKNICIEANGGRFVFSNGNLYLLNPEDDKEFAAFSAFVEGCDEVRLPGNKVLALGVHSDNPALDIYLPQPEQLKGLQIRFARTEDSIVLKEGKKKVFKLLQDMGIPGALRPRVPVLIENEVPIAVFCSAFGGRDRICRRYRLPLAPSLFSLYIIKEG